MDLDFLIVGGGVIGLSLAWELAQRDKRVRIIDRQDFGRATSWVGAGILPPPLQGATHDALEQLRASSHHLHRDWSRRLLDETGVDNELLRTGGIYFARDAGEAAALRGAMQWAADDGVEVESLSNGELMEIEPGLSAVAEEVLVAYHLPDEMQVRSPRHLRALILACEKRGVELTDHVAVRGLDVQRDHVAGVITNHGTLRANEVVLCCGPWIAALLEPLEISMPVEPWRGQLTLWQPKSPLVHRVINEGLRYFVPRADGQLLVGATVEDVGFDESTTQVAIDELSKYARGVLPELRTCEVAKSWAGLRPKTPDGLPFLGRVPGLKNLSVASGHYRSGLHLSTGTAVFMADLLLHDTPPEHHEAFRLTR